MGDPLPIRDERRDAELTRIKASIAAHDRELEKQGQLTQGMHYALFGLPEDRTNNGLVGTMASMKRTLNGILVTVICGVGIDVLARAVFHA